MAHQGYGFCEFLTEEDAEYACKIMNQIKLWGKPIRVNKVRPGRHFFNPYAVSCLLANFLILLDPFISGTQYFV
jgi:RNA recognition motif-containing protein